MPVTASNVPPEAIHRTAPTDAYMLLAGAVLVIVGSFLPWAKVIAVFLGEVTVNGVDGGDGYFAIGLSVPLIVFALRKLSSGARVPTGWALTISVILVGFSVLELGDASNKITKANSDAEGFGHVSIGAGLWVLLAGAVLALVGTIMARRRQ
jgi:hypothetical protein